MTGVETLLLEHGLPGAIIVTLLAVVTRQDRRIGELQEEMKKTLREVIPAVAALERVLEAMKETRR